MNLPEAQVLFMKISLGTAELFSLIMVICVIGHIFKNRLYYTTTQRYPLYISAIQVLSILGSGLQTALNLACVPIATVQFFIGTVYFYLEFFMAIVVYRSCCHGISTFCGILDYRLILATFFAASILTLMYTYLDVFGDGPFWCSFSYKNPAALYIAILHFLLKMPLLFVVAFLYAKASRVIEKSLELYRNTEVILLPSLPVAISVKPDNFCRTPKNTENALNDRNRESCTNNDSITQLYLPKATATTSTIATTQELEQDDYKDAEMTSCSIQPAATSTIVELDVKDLELNCIPQLDHNNSTLENRYSKKSFSSFGLKSRPVSIVSSDPNLRYSYALRINALNGIQRYLFANWFIWPPVLIMALLEASLKDPVKYWWVYWIEGMVYCISGLLNGIIYFVNLREKSRLTKELRH